MSTYCVLGPSHYLFDFRAGQCGLLAHFTEKETESWSWKVFILRSHNSGVCQRRVFSYCFIEIEFIYHEIHTRLKYISVILSIATELGNYCHNLILEHFNYPRKNLPTC